MKLHHHVLAVAVATLVTGLAAAHAQTGPARGEASATPAAQAPARPGPAEQRMVGLDKGPDRHLTFAPDAVDWRPGPASLASGAQFAVLEGDPARAGVFTMRLKLPDGFVIRPHSHPNVERVTVLGGTFRLGAGAQVDPASAQRLPSGSYTSMPPGMVHYAIAEGETIVQLTSVGPWVINYVDPKDDPRKR